MSSRHGRNAIVTVLGRKGSGKSTAIGRLVEASIKLKPERIVLVADFLGDQEFPVSGFVRVPLQRLPDALAAGKNRLIVDFASSKVDAPVFATAFLKASRHLCGALVVVDELDFPANIGSGFAPEDFQHLVSYGRHYSISLIAAARRPQDIPKLLLSQADYVFVGQLTSPRELKYLEDWGFDSERLRALGVGEFLVYDAASAAFKFSKFQPFQEVKA